MRSRGGAVRRTVRFLLLTWLLVFILMGVSQLLVAGSGGRGVIAFAIVLPLAFFGAVLLHRRSLRAMYRKVEEHGIDHPIIVGGVGAVAAFAIGTLQARQQDGVGNPLGEGIRFALTVTAAYTAITLWRSRPLKH
jgi:hypothetical protein